MNKFGLILTMSLFAAPAFADRLDVTMTDVSIRDVIHNGSGCPLGDEVSARFIAPHVIKILVPEFSARTGAGVSLRDIRKNCQIGLDIERPNGMTFQLTRAFIAVKSDLNESQAGDIKLSTYFQGSAETAEVLKTMEGPASQAQYLHLALDRSAFASCEESRLLNVNLAARLDRSELAEVGELGLRGAIYLFVNWEPCK